MSNRELCSCKSPIISIDSHLTEPDSNGKIDQIQEMGCRNKNCPKYNMSIRIVRDPVNY